MIKRATYRIAVFHETLVISTQTNKEQYARHVLKAVYPFSPLALLATHVDHDHFLTLLQRKCCFCDANCPGTTLHNILLSRLVVLFE